MVYKEDERYVLVGIVSSGECGGRNPGKLSEWLYQNSAKWASSIKICVQNVNHFIKLKMLKFLQLVGAQS